MISVKTLDRDRVTFHSKARPPPSPTIQDNFWAIIRSWDNQSLWSNFDCDGDGTWIYRAILGGSLIIAHDGSYQPKLAQDMCSYAAVFHCTETNQYAKISWVEKTDSYTAYNYRAEILGGIAAQLILRAALQGKQLHKSTLITAFCDNLGVMHHGNHANRPLAEKQK